MRIINKCDARVEFAAIRVGDAFLYDSCLFVKMNQLTKNNAYCFVDNAVACVPQAVLVTPVEAEIIIYSKGVE